MAKDGNQGVQADQVSALHGVTVGGFLMNDDDYISIPVTPDLLEDPDEPAIHSLEAMMRRLETEWIGSGVKVSIGVEPRPPIGVQY